MFTEIEERTGSEGRDLVESPETFFSMSENEARVRIVALGIGGMGQNAMENLALDQVEGLEIYSVNTDMQALSKCLGSQAVQIGKKRTCGRGAGGDSEIGRLSAEDDVETLKNIVFGAELVFIAAGMGGGTGTGAAPVIGRICREMGIVTIGVVTTPMHYEGPRRKKKACAGLALMRRAVDSIMVIENEKLTTLMSDDDISIIDAFRKADEVLVNALKSIAKMINLHGYINLDLADLNNVLKKQSTDECQEILIGVGEAFGEGRAQRAAIAALENPLLASSDIHASVDLLINVAGNEEMGFQEALSSVRIIEEKAGNTDREIFIGVVTDNDLGDGMCVTVVANGLGRPGTVAVPKEFPARLHEKGMEAVRRSDEDASAVVNVGNPRQDIPWQQVERCHAVEQSLVHTLDNEKPLAREDSALEQTMAFADRESPLSKRGTESPVHPLMSNGPTGASRRDSFIRVEKNDDLADVQNGRSPIIVKEIWNTPAGIRRQLKIKRLDQGDGKVVDLDRKVCDNWQSRVIKEPEKQVTLTDPGFQVACS